MTFQIKLSAFAAGVLLLSAGAAHASNADGSLKPANIRLGGLPGFALSSHGGLVNPGVLVGFNPQPDPPGDVALPTIDLGNAHMPVITNLAESEGWAFILALTGLDGDGSVIPLPTFNREGGAHTTRAVLGGHVFLIGLLFGPGLVDEGSLRGFNPQPDPPGNVLAGQFNFQGPVDPWMAFSIFEDDHQLSFTYRDGVPEPAEWALMLLGFSLVGAMARRRRAPLAAG